jgi:gamma-glutamyltranspeptidase/glutathione hydrolase
MRARNLTLAAALLLAAACAPDRPAESAGSTLPSTWPYHDPIVATGEHAMVVTDAPLATQVGVDVLRRGGNAVDAAIAIAFALAVVYPEAGNLGGGGFMVTRMADGTAAALDFREVAPLAATRDMYLDSSGNVTDQSVTGHRASGVPGSVAGLAAAHERFGTLPWDSLLAPAIRFAEAGFTVDTAFAGSVVDAAERLRGYDASSALFLPGGQPLAAGSQWRNPDLARVLRRIAQRGRAGFYDGETADLIVAEMKRGGGLITRQDLQRYQTEWRQPVVFTYRGHTLYSMPPASSGGITLGIALGMLDGFAAGDDATPTPRALHLTAEALRRAFADRNTFLGDPAFVSIPRQLTERAYIDSLRATIDAAHATPSARIVPGLGEFVESDHTTHFSVVDAQGNAVALTTTLNELYGSAVTIAGAGFLMNDEMDDFTSKPGVPNMFGLVQGSANAIAPGKRMLSAMTPTVVVAPDGSPLLVTGARGGPRIISAVLEVIVNVIDYDMDIGQAVYAPRIHHQHLPDVLYYESGGLDSAVITQLTALGHSVQAFNSYIGNAPSILRRNGVWTGVADPRQGGRALGY